MKLKREDIIVFWPDDNPLSPEERELMFMDWMECLPADSKKSIVYNEEANCLELCINIQQKRPEFNATVSACYVFKFEKDFPRECWKRLFNIDGMLHQFFQAVKIMETYKSCLSPGTRKVFDEIFNPMIAEAKAACTAEQLLLLEVSP